MKFLNLMWRNLGRKKVRTLFTFLSILVAFFLFGLLMAVRNGFDAGVEMAGQDRLLTIHKVSLIQPLPIKYTEQIRNTVGVARATHLTWFGGVYQDPKNFFAQMAVDTDSFLELYPEYEIDEEQKATWIATRTGALVGRKLAERFGWQIGDKIPIQANIWRPTDGSNTFEFDLVAIYDGETQDTDETQFFFHHEYLKERSNTFGLVGWFAVEVDDPETAVEVADTIDRRFANSPAETKTTTEKAFMQGFADQIGNTGAILMAIVAVVLFVILLIAANTMAQSVRERIKELGVLKTLGFTDGGVMSLVMGESILLTLSAAGVGLALSWLMMPALQPLVEMFLPVFYLPQQAVVTGVILALGVAVVSAAVPAWTAMRLPIVEALRRG